MSESGRNLRLILEYQGTRFRGFQIQRGERTVAEVLAEAISKVLGERPRIFAAGRTDAGVHAYGQVANFRSRSRLDDVELREKLNDALPKDVAILRVEEVPFDFHARHSARQRIYLYRINTRRSAFLKDTAWWVRSKLDFQRMKVAADGLVGRHDFSAYADKDTVPEDPVLTLFSIDLKREGTLFELRFRAERFLPRMVRRLVGVLVKVGQERLPEAAAADILEHPRPEVAEWTAPPWGLFLESVIYDEVVAPRRKSGDRRGQIQVWDETTAPPRPRRPTSR